MWFPIQKTANKQCVVPQHATTVLDFMFEEIIYVFIYMNMM